VAEVVAAGGQYVDALSLVRTRVAGVTQTNANDRSLVNQLHSAITDQYVPAKRELVTKIWSAQFVIVEDELLEKFGPLLEKLEDDLIVADQYKYDAAADDYQQRRQEDVRHAISSVRGTAVRLYSPP